MSFFTKKQFNRLVHNSLSPLAIDPAPAAYMYMYENSIKHSWLLTNIVNCDCYLAFGLYEKKGEYVKNCCVNLTDLTRLHHGKLFFDINFQPAHRLSVYKKASNKDKQGLSPRGWSETEFVCLGMQATTKLSEHDFMISKPNFHEFSAFDKPYI